MEGQQVTVKLLPFSADVPAAPSKRTVNADGSVEFRCEGCGVDVFCAVDDGFEFPACMECRFFGEHPQIQRPEYRR
jgi:hypothetical protein